MSSTPAPGRDAGPTDAELGLTARVPYRTVFERFPSGVLVTDHGARVLAHNPAAELLLGEALDRDRVRCCDLLGCHRAGTPLAEHCITALALERSAALPELRVDVQGRLGEQTAVWVTAAPLGDADAAVVLQLRSGVTGDRRRRTEPHWLIGTRLRLYTLGRTRLESGEARLSGEWLAHRPGELLKYLACERGRVVPLDELIDVFWSGTGRAGPSNVRQAIHMLRERLEPQREKRTPSSFVVARKGGYELDLENVWIDADDFEASARSGMQALGRADRETAEPVLMRAAALYRGDFLADEPYADWALAERDRLRDLGGAVLRALAELRAGSGDESGALDALQRLAEHEPFDEAAQRELLALLLRRGRHTEAQRRYEVLRRRFRRAFGAEPEFTLAELIADNVLD